MFLKINVFNVHSLFLLFSSLFLIACNNHSKFKIIGDNNIVYGNVKYVKETEYTLKYKFDEFQKGSPFAITEYWFDERTNLIKVKEEFFGAYDSIVFKYDNNNNLIEKIDFSNGKKKLVQYYYKDNHFIQEVDFVNDSLIKQVTIEDSNSNVKRKEKHMMRDSYYYVISKFDEDGKLTEESTYDSIGNDIGKDNWYRYNPQGLLTYSSISYLVDDSRLNLYDQTKTEYQYDGRNLIIYKKYHFYSERSEYKYSKFDKYGNWLTVEFKENSRVAGISRCLIERKILYYEK